MSTATGLATEKTTTLAKVGQPAMLANKIEVPTAVDSLHKLKDAFLNEQGWVPVNYLFNAEGKLKTRAAGEFGVGVLQTALDKMFTTEVAIAA